MASKSTVWHRFLEKVASAFGISGGYHPFKEYDIIKISSREKFISPHNTHKL